MKKLICTPFYYTVPSWWPTFRGEIFGSYLGKKPASKATLRAFLSKNKAPKDARITSIGHSYESEWISK